MYIYIYTHTLIYNNVKQLSVLLKREHHKKRSKTASSRERQMAGATNPIQAMIQ